MNKTNSRPIYLNLFKISMPATAVVSILHRLSGLLMVLLLPIVIYLLQLSLTDEQGFQSVIHFFNHPITKILFVVMIWMFFHHLCAGIRFLLIDLDVAVIKASAIKTAWVAHIGAMLLTLFMLGVIL